MTNKPSSLKQKLLDRVSQVMVKANQLTACTFIYKTLLEAVKDTEVKTTSINDIEELKYMKYPPLFLLADRLDEEALKDLNADLELVYDKTSTDKKESIKRWLSSKDDLARDWSSHMFELLVKAQILKCVETVSFDVGLPNGKDIDMYIKKDGLEYFIECTALLEGERDKQHQDEVSVTRKQDPSYVDVGYGDPYYDTVRIYNKVFEKLAPDFDLQKYQLSPNRKNVLFLSVSAPLGNPACSCEPEVGWAFDYLFSSLDSTMQVKKSRSNAVAVSIFDYLEFCARDLQKKGKTTREKYCEDYSKIASAPNRIGAVMLFCGARFYQARVNYNADSASMISHSEIVFFESVLKNVPKYYERIIPTHL